MRSVARSRVRFLFLFCLVFSALVLSVVLPVHADMHELDDDDDIEQHSEEDINAQMEQQLEIEAEDELERNEREFEDIEDRLDDDLEDRLERKLRFHEDMEDDADERLEEEMEDRIEHLERTQDARMDQNAERLNQLWEIEDTLEQLDDFVIEDEYIALLDEAQLNEAISRGAKVLRSQPMSSLGSVLVTFKGLQPASQSELEVADKNHVYVLDAVSNPMDTAGSGIQSVNSIRNMAIDLGIQNLQQNGHLDTAGERLNIGMMDSSIDTNHPCLKNSAVIEKVFIANGHSQNLLLTKQHGTAMASVIVGDGECGLLSHAQLHNAVVFGENNQGLVVASADQLIVGLDWLLQQGVSVINLSLSGPPNQVLEKALSQVMGKGITVVASVGNEGAGAFPRYPAAYPGVVAVTALDRKYAVYVRAVQGEHLRFAAPGVAVALADARNGSMAATDGTSIASAFASVVIAIAKQQGVTIEQLQSRAIDLGRPGRDSVFGYGLIQAYTN
ncbi:MAG: S8 family serine peptidase [Oleibacter sp.]|nr:S8 family serine peptidase [Thalassolituus sp.]